MELILLFGSCGLIGKEIFNSLVDKKYNVYGFDINKNFDSERIYELDLTNFKSVDDLFQTNLESLKKYEKIHIIYLSAIDSKLDQVWEPLHEFSLKEWRKFSTTNQEAMLYLISKFIHAKVNNIIKAELNFILFPSLYNFIAPDQQAYDNKMKVMKPFYYIGSKSLVRDLNRYINSSYAHIKVFSNCVVPHLVVQSDQKVNQNLLNKTLTKQRTDVRDIIKTTEFLINRPSNLVGQEIIVDGGWSIV